ncbi:MAG TPA: glycerol kinase GlpK [Acetobacteraceae bacterium]|jgi:glycerol kinase|nr:glycerol kinase GlpK [Acetobacteraceae bacterium]
MTRFIGAIDQGTTSSRFIVFDRTGATVAMAQREHRQIFPQPGWIEHDPMEILGNTRVVIAEALRGSGLSPRDLAAVGITNQRETTLLWDRATGAPVHNALVWQDTRVDPLVAEYAREGGQDRFRAATGLPLASYFSALKLRWLLDHVPAAQARAEAGDLMFGTIDSWLMWHLAGVHVTDVTNASRTQLMNLATLDWDASLLLAFGVPASVLSRIVASSGVVATSRGELDGVPIAGILGDQQAALVGQTCFAPGEAKNTYGTGCFLLLNTGTLPVASTSGLVTTVAYRLGDAPACYALEGSIAITGALVQWLRDNLGLIGSSAEIEALAASVEDNGGVYFVPAFSGLYAPYWRADARGVIAGLTRYAGKGHLARAVLEATAYQTMDVVAAMERDSGVKMHSLRVDGGMVVNEMLMQFQADILDVPVARPAVIETTALGAAYAAGLAVGYWRDLHDLRGNWGVARTWEPRMGDETRAGLAAGWHKAVERSLGWA